MSCLADFAKETIGFCSFEVLGIIDVCSIPTE